LGEGGQDLRGTFRIKKASKNFFPEMLATGGGGGVISKIFSGYTTFFRKYEKNFPDIPENFQDI
jgi:hypothetical protein